MSMEEILQQLLQLDEHEQMAQAMYFEWEEQHAKIPMSDRRIPLLRPQGYTPSLPDPVISEKQAFLPDENIAMTKHPRYFTSTAHTHDFFELCYVAEGHGRHLIDNQEFVLEKGEMCILPPGVFHAPEAFSEYDLMINLQIRKSAFWATFGELLTTGNVLSDFFRQVLQQEYPENYLIFQMHDDLQIRDLILFMYQEFTGRQLYYRTVLEAAARLLFAAILRGHCQDAAVYSTQEHSSNTVIVSALHDMEESGGTLDLDQLAGRYGYSPSHMSRMFRQYTGDNFVTFRRRMRMQRAAMLLRQSEQPVSEIAAQVGYGSLSDFYRNFRNTYGCTPQAWRNSIQEKIRT